MKTNKLGRAAGVIVKDNKVLLMWRYRHGSEYCVFPGGGIEEGETIEQGLEREIFEELNLKIKDYKKIFEFLNNYTTKYNSPRMDYYYLIKEFEGEIKIGNPELSQQSRENIYRPEWVEIDHLANLDLLPKESELKLMDYLQNNK